MKRYLMALVTFTLVFLNGLGCNKSPKNILLVFPDGFTGEAKIYFNSQRGDAIDTESKIIIFDFGNGDIHTTSNNLDFVSLQISARYKSGKEIPLDKPTKNLSRSIYVKHSGASANGYYYFVLEED